jgi:hypothetical protein
LMMNSEDSLAQNRQFLNTLGYSGDISIFPWSSPAPAATP